MNEVEFTIPVISPPKPNRMIPWEPYKGAVQKERVPKPANLSGPEAGNTLEKVAYQIKSITRKPSKKRINNPQLSVSLNNDTYETGAEDLPSDPVLTSTDALHRVATIMSSPASSIVDGCIVNDELTNLQRKIYDLQLFCERLTVEKDTLNDQLQIQSKVNGELKQLLVATMGDDLQLHLQGLSQDKVRLAQDVVHYTEQLSEDKENLDSLTIQRDILRSKYLASSVMADELISWRLFLIRQFEQAQTCIWHMLKERETFKHKLYATFLNQTQSIHLLKGEEDIKVLEPNIDGIISCIKDQSTAIKQKLGGQHLKDDSNGFACPLSELTDTEKASKRILEIDSTKFYATTPCNEHERDKKVRQAKMMGFPLNSNFKNLTVNCCGQCFGEIQVV